MNRGELDAKLQELGITNEMVQASKLPFQEEPEDLIDAGIDYYGRKQKLAACANKAWLEMKASARLDGHDIKIISAFRSIEYQCNLISKKLTQGQTILKILRTNAIPGYSEHHSGRALDLHSGNGAPLDECFEKEPAFFWLTENAGKFKFYMSYPEKNGFGIIYEPWHWCYRD